MTHPVDNLFYLIRSSDFGFENYMWGSFPEAETHVELLRRMDMYKASTFDIYAVDANHLLAAVIVTGAESHTYTPIEV